jgi:Ser/Thr protein kinase RdoA (MazF antagonist)
MIRNELRAKIESFYDVGNIAEISTLEGGYWNQTLKLETGKGTFVLRISRPRTKAEGVAAQHALMRFIHARVREVPLPLAGKSGADFFVDENRVVSLLPFMRGEMASRKIPEQQTSAAEMLARLHRAGVEFPEHFARPGFAPLADFNWEENSNWRLPEIESLLEKGAQELKRRLIEPIGEAALICIEEIAARKTQIFEELKTVRVWITELKKSGRKLVFAPTHGDFYPSNLLTQENRISAVLDWDECQSEWLSYELGRALWEFCRYDERAVLDAKNAEDFLRAYQASGGVVTETEIDLLVPFIRAVRVQEVLFSLGEAIHGEWWEPEYTLYNLEALDNIERENLFV